ncbi:MULTISPECIES: thiazolylpeptide-type bacteriocin [unclassified Streptomyces]|uniref:thiazolylpeptide-type bacteriocin n=1 Tax=unclassified Streptomyces TaxID=2593676 RepID=UPI0033D554BE
MDKNLGTEDFASFELEEIEVLDVAEGAALPEVGASSGDWLCCSSSSSSSCC